MRYLDRPFRFGPNGRAVTVDQDSDELINARILAILTTRPGERPLAPGYGTQDPTFTGFDAAELRAAISQYGPPGIELQAINADYTTDGRQDVTVQWERDQNDEQGA